MLGSDLDRLEQEVLHTFIDELQLGLVDLHAELSQAWFLLPPSEETAA